MKRIALIFALLLTCLTLPAHAWEVSPEHEALAAQFLPSYAVLDGCSDGERTVLLVTCPEDEKRLAFHAEGAVTLSEPLPEHLFQIREALLYEEVATLLMEDYEGTAYFVGCLKEGEIWATQVSQALPAGVCFDDYHSWEEYVILCFPHPEGVQSRWFEGEAVWIEYVAYLQEDGRWLVETIHNENEEAFHINHVGAPGYDITLTGVAYGTVTLERDMRYIDWSTFPMCLDDALAYLTDDMGVIGADALPLYADADCTQVIAEYLIATPVTILSREGGMAQVRIADSDVIGWLDAESLLLGAAQLFLDEEGEWLITAEYYANIFDGPKGVAIYDAPEGEILCNSQWPAWYTVMSTSVDGWYHICFPESMESGWVRAEDGKIVE